MPTDAASDFSSKPAAIPAKNGFAEIILNALAPAERLVICLTLLIGALAYALSVRFGQAVDWAAFLISFVPCVGLIALGLYLRLKKDMVRAAMTAVAAGIYIGFTGVITILIYHRFPFETSMIDAQLMTFDKSVFGYDWIGFTTAMAAYPALGKFLGWVYGTSLMQLFFVIFVLGYLRRETDLHRVLIAGSLSLLFAVAIWWVWPSLGPAAHLVLPANVESALGLVHGAEVGARMLQMAEMGNAVITPSIIMGTIAFPSYHTVMVFLAVVFVWRSWAFWPLVALNIPMLPSILSHGAHHLSDMLGGVAVFVVAYLIAAKLVPNQHPTSSEV